MEDYEIMNQLCAHTVGILVSPLLYSELFCFEYTGVQYFLVEQLYCIFALSSKNTGSSNNILVTINIIISN